MLFNRSMRTLSLSSPKRINFPLKVTMVHSKTSHSKWARLANMDTYCQQRGLCTQTTEGHPQPSHWFSCMRMICVHDVCVCALQRVTVQVPPCHRALCSWQGSSRVGSYFPMAAELPWELPRLLMLSLFKGTLELQTPAAMPGFMEVWRTPTQVLTLARPMLHPQSHLPSPFGFTFFLSLIRKQIDF